MDIPGFFAFLTQFQSMGTQMKAGKTFLNRKQLRKIVFTITKFNKWMLIIAIQRKLDEIICVSIVAVPGRYLIIPYLGVFINKRIMLIKTG